MRLLVCGSRGWKDYSAILCYITQKCPRLVIHGGASGADQMADRAAKELGIPTACFDANWQFYGRAAGHIHNLQMLDLGQPDEVVAFWDGESPGTENMVEIFIGRGLQVTIVGPQERPGVHIKATILGKSISIDPFIIPATVAA